MNGTTIFFPGSFRPFTIGHASLVKRALQIFDRVVIGIGDNISKDVASATDDLDPRFGSAVQRRGAIEALYAHNPAVSVVTYSGLTAEAAKQAGAVALLRGIRNTADMEYERQMAAVNRNILGLESVLLLTEPEMEWVSSSIVRELRAFGHDYDHLLP